MVYERVRGQTSGRSLPVYVYFVFFVFAYLLIYLESYTINSISTISK